MIQSMTGFSEKGFSSKTIYLKVSIKTLNHRFFDWSFKGASIGELENRLKSVCQEKISRGRIEVNLELGFLDASGWDLFINEPMLEKILGAVDGISRKIGIPVNLSLDGIFKVPRLAELKRKDISRKEALFIENGFKQALESLLKERVREGRQICARLLRHAAVMKKSVSRVERLFARHPRVILDKLRARLKDLNHANSFSEDRLSEEAAFLAQRYDLAEELLRLKTHLSAMEELLSTESREPIGRKLDFLAQEIYREANTLNSKSQDIEMIKEGLKIKGEVESIRQHVQNLE